jgi:hypothetical protein
MNAFDRNAATLTPAGKAAVDQINELLRSNGEMNLVVTIAPDEDQLGKVKAQEIMTELEIAPTRRLRGLGDRQRKALLEKFA